MTARKDFELGRFVLPQASVSSAAGNLSPSVKFFQLFLSLIPQQVFFFSVSVSLNWVKC